MKKWKLIIATLTLVTIAGGTLFTVWANSPTTFVAPSKADIFTLVNNERAKLGVHSLKLDSDIETVAQMKADDFVAKGYYSHYIPGINKQYTDDMYRYIKGRCSTISENINNNVVSAENALTSWMGSASHRQAILDARYTTTGIGVSQDSDGDYFVVQQFCVNK